MSGDDWRILSKSIISLKTVDNILSYSFLRLLRDYVNSVVFYYIIKKKKKNPETKLNYKLIIDTSI